MSVLVIGCVGAFSYNALIWAGTTIITVSYLHNDHHNDHHYYPKIDLQRKLTVTCRRRDGASKALVTPLREMKERGGPTHFLHSDLYKKAKCLLPVSVHQERIIWQKS